MRTRDDMREAFAALVAHGEAWIAHDRGPLARRRRNACASRRRRMADFGARAGATARDTAVVTDRYVHAKPWTCRRLRRGARARRRRNPLPAPVNHDVSATGAATPVTGLMTALRRLLASAIAHVAARGELFAIEYAEEKERLFVAAIAALVSVAAAFFALGLATVAVLLLRVGHGLPLARGNRAAGVLRRAWRPAAGGPFARR